MNPFQGAFILGRHKYGIVSFWRVWAVMSSSIIAWTKKRKITKRKKKIVPIGYESWIYEE